MIKQRNSKNRTETEEIKKTWQGHTAKLYKRILHFRHNHSGVVRDILGHEVKWALGSVTTKVVEVMGSS